jgi:hypothetical protein
LITSAAYLREWDKVLAVKDGAGKTNDNTATVQGGIDARNIAVDRQGEFISGVLSDKALEDMIMKAPGLRGVIVGISPVPDLMALLAGHVS